MDWSAYRQHFDDDPDTLTVKENAELLRLLGQYSSPNDVCLDYGCGAGQWTAHLTTLGRHTIGFDICGEAIEIARSTYPHLNFVCSEECHSFEAGGFDLILVSWVVQSVVSDERFVSMVDDLRRLLSTKGRLIVVDNMYPGQRRLVRQTPFGDLFENGSEKSPLRFFVKILW
jgi:SAM-dependent methyltransferase